MLCGLVEWHKIPELQSGNCFFNSEPRFVHYHQPLMAYEYAHVHECVVTSMECVRTPHTLMTHFLRMFETQLEIRTTKRRHAINASALCVLPCATAHARRSSWRHVSHSKLLGTCPSAWCAHRPDIATSPNGIVAELSVHAGNVFPCCTLGEATTQVFFCFILARPVDITRGTINQHIRV